MRALRLIFFVLLTTAGGGSLGAQTPAADKPVEDKQATAENKCREYPMRAERTYIFRALPKEKDPKGWYGRKTWYQKLFPFWAKQKRLDDILTIEKLLTRPIPFNETGRSKAIRAASEEKLLALQSSAEENWRKWLAENPSAGEEETRRAEIRLRYQGLATTRLPRFDWRENELDVGAVGSQGFGCNTCWAFATVDAMQAGRRLVALRAGRTGFDESLAPSVQQLVSCMLPNPEDFCKVNWHGEAFTFMVDKGLPLGGPDLYKAFDAKTWRCDSETYARALTWNFISPDPRRVSTVDEIKRALILYGPVVSMIHFDQCFWLYGGGVFNGENNKKGSHFVLIIGWDDAKEAWLVKNSYGKEWGEKGFGWIKYGSNNIGESSAAILADPQEEERIAREFGTEEQ